MLENTRGIILRQIKFTDSGIITQIYTRKFGRQSFLIKGMRNKKTGKHNILFQPMFILDLVLYYKQKREMQMLKEFSSYYTPSDIYSNVKKSSVALFLGEVLTSVLIEESPHTEMYDFIEESIIYFDKCKDGYANFHIAFLSGLSGFLGFEPGQRLEKKDRFFDMINGIFVQTPPVHGNYADEEITAILADFFVASYDSIDKIYLTGKKRNDVLEALLRFYSLHLPGLKKIKSLEILKEVFS
jgi:DNA repair protein RecO (recombination protein O)